MREQTFFTLLSCTLFLTAQAAVDAGRGATNQMPILSALQVYVPNSLDLQLKESVQQQLRTTVRNYNPNGITILTQDGIVTLKGIVKTQAQAEILEREVLRVTGVTQVKNILVLSTDTNQ